MMQEITRDNDNGPDIPANALVEFERIVQGLSDDPTSLLYPFDGYPQSICKIIDINDRKSIQDIVSFHSIGKLRVVRGNALIPVQTSYAPASGGDGLLLCGRLLVTRFYSRDYETIYKVFDTEVDEDIYKKFVTFVYERLRSEDIVYPIKHPSMYEITSLESVTFEMLCQFHDDLAL